MLPRKRWSSFRTSFLFKLFIIFTLLTFLIASLVTTLYIVTEIRQTRRFAADQLKMQAKQLADSARLPLYAENRDLLRKMAEQASHAAEVHAVLIIAPDGRVLAEVRSPSHSSKDGIVSQTVEVRSNLMMDTVESSLTGGPPPPAALLGYVRMERGTEELSQTIRQTVLLSVCVAAGFWLSVSLLCYLVFRRVTRSFRALVDGINAVEDGDLASRIVITSDDEPGRAALAVNNLANALQLRSEENRRLQEDRLNMERQMLQTQKLESLGVMAGGVAHDFNNLLQAILGNMELAAMKLPDNSVSQKYLANAMISGKHASQLTNLMLTYLGKGLVAKKALNLNELVNENAEILRTAATASVSMKLNLFPELPTIMADEAHIQQVIMNLIINASESIEQLPGFVTVTTGTQRCDQACLAASLLEEKPESGRFVFLEVSDNGCGMSEETIKCLFDPFFTTKFTGRGLGMSAVLGIMRTHCGALFVKSEPGKGTTFRALFPVSESASITPSQEPVLPLPEVRTHSEKPLLGVALVVDDERPVLRVCAKMVQLCGFKVITACDGIDAIAKFREHADEITVVLMDLTMPNMDGIMAMSEIYLIRPDIKIILSSGYNEDELSERAIRQAPSGFIRKPYNLKVLQAELQSVVQGK